MEFWVLGLGVGSRVKDKADLSDKTGLWGRDGLLARPDKQTGRADLCSKGDLTGRTAWNPVLGKVF